MADQEFMRLKALFDSAAELPAGERGAFLEARCGGDTLLRRRVEAMIATAEGDEKFLGTLTREGKGVERRTLAMGSSEGPGTKIGPYKLLQLIGAGGLGLVFMAEQEEPVRRRVALKIIKLGMDTRSVIARFEAERQALAMMDHPNIARVLDAGATGLGRPYFVMELVKGEPVTDYCDKNSLSMRERLGLFQQVCHAVQHAHQKGIIHRDIKPSNVLVTMADGRPIPKVIDFGIAKAIHSRLTEKTVFTEFRQLIGTPEYMSPEQAEMSGVDVDTRSDIYSLGVLLYELLTGATPFDAKALRSAAFGELRRIIREDEPERPSTRLSHLGQTLTSVAAHRHTDPARLRKLVRGDLDWIVMRCLEKDRTRRYDTATGLAKDIERHLSNQPVEATPPSAAYRARKFLRRHRGPVAAAGLVVAALVVGLSLAAWQYAEARLSAREARDSERVAVTKKSEAESSLNLAVANEKRAEEAEGKTRESLAREVAAHRESEGHRLAAQAMTVSGEDPTLGLLLAMEGAKRASGDDVNIALYRALEVQNERRVMLGHDGIVFHVAVSPDGRRVLSGDGSNLVIVWDGGSGQELHRLDEHTGFIRGVGFSPDGRAAFSVADDGTARLWDVETGVCEHVLRHGKEVGCGAMSPDGAVFYTGCADGSVHAWETRTGLERSAMSGHAAGVSIVRASADGSMVLTLGEDHVARVHDARSGAVLHDLPLESGAELWEQWLEYAAFVPGDRVITRSRTGAVEMWDARSGKGTGRLGEPGAKAGRVWASADGRLVMIQWVTQGYEFEVWDAAEGKRVSRLEVRAPEGLSVAPRTAFSPDGKVVALVLGERVCPFDVATGRAGAPLRGHVLGTNTLAFFGDSQRMVTGGADLAVREWTLAPLRESRGLARRLAEPGVALDALASDGMTALVVRRAPAARGREVVDTRSGATVTELDVPFGEDGIGWSRDHRLLCANTGGRMRVWDTVARRLLVDDPEPVLPSSVSDDGRFLAALRDGIYAPGDRLSVYDLSTGKAVMDVREKDAHCTRAVLSPDGTKLLTANGHHRVCRVWDVAKGAVAHSFPTHPAYVTDVAWTPDGKRVIEFSIDTTARVYDAATYALVATIEGLPAMESGLSVSPDGGLVAILAPLELDLHEVETGRRVAQWKHNGTIARVAFTPDGHDLVQMMDGGVIRYLPLDPLEQAGRVVPRQLAASEMARFDVGTKEERAAAGRRVSDSAVLLQRQAEQALSDRRLDDSVSLFERALNLRKRSSSTMMYNAACAYARRAGVADRAEADRKKDSDASVALLRRAVEAGFKDRDLMGRDTDLEAVRGRAEFGAILGLIP